MTVNVISIPSRDEDEATAAKLRGEMKPHLDSLAEILNRAVRSGLDVGFSIPRDQNGRFFVGAVVVSRPL